MFYKEKPDYNRRQYGFYMIDELVPEDHFLRQVDSEVDFDFGMFKYQKIGEMDSEYPFLFCSKSDFWMEISDNKVNSFENTKRQTSFLAFVFVLKDSQIFIWESFY